MLIVLLLFIYLNWLSNWLLLVVTYFQTVTGRNQDSALTDSIRYTFACYVLIWKWL